MSGTFDKRPELMILIAVGVAALLGLFGTVASCSMLLSAADRAQETIATLPGNGPDDIMDGYIDGDLDDLEDELEDLLGTDDGMGSFGWSQDDVPATMEIDVPELQDDLQALINYDLTNGLSIANADAKVTELTKDTVGTPELKNGQVLCQVSGKATINNAGKTETIDYTSYYYAEDPTAEKITWYIYAYDLGSYDLFPDGFKDVSGDPLKMRDYLLGDSGADAARNSFAHDRGGDAQAA